MRHSVIKHNLKRDKPSLVVTLHLTDPSVYELTSLIGFHGIWMDMEHHAYSLETAAGLMRAARVGSSDILIRPGKGEFAQISRMFEAGAQGVMYPRCDSPEEAAQVVDAVKFAPLGRRGFDGSGPDMPYLSVPMDQYIKESNEQSFVVIQLEEQQAVDRAEEIASVPGVDAIMLGPADFSILSQIPGQFDHPLVQKATESVAKAAKNTGKHWACLSPSVDHSRQMIELGARILLHNADILILSNALKSIKQSFAEAGFEFHDPWPNDNLSYMEK